MTSKSLDVAEVESEIVIDAIIEICSRAAISKRGLIRGLMKMQLSLLRAENESECSLGDSDGLLVLSVRRYE